MDGDGRDRKLSTAEALGAWRDASREVDHANQAASVAELAQATALKAEQAAQETADAARAALEAATRAAASAKAAADAAHLTREQADADLEELRAKLDSATAEEVVARGRHRELQDRAFQRYGLGNTTEPDPERPGAA